MTAQIVHPFLESAKMVLEQMVSIKISMGQVTQTHPELSGTNLWIVVQLKGEVDGRVAFGLVPETAIKIASAMMGGFQLQEVDGMCQSAISELGNMISGNACSIMSQSGVHVDISPPQWVNEQEFTLTESTAFTAPLMLSELGTMEIKLLTA